MTKDKSNELFTNVINNPWFLRGLFFLLSVVLLGFVYQDVLYQFFWRNYFLNTNIFFEETMQQSAGLLIYCGRFFNQLFYYPVLSSVFISTLLVLLQMWLSWLFDERNGSSFFSFIPSFLLLFLLIKTSYAIYGVFEIGFFFANYLGIVLSLSIYTLYRIITSDSWVKDLLFLFGGAVLFYYIGIYSLVPMIMVAMQLTSNQKRKWIILLIQVFLLIVLSFVLSKYVRYEMFSHVALMPLIDPFFKPLFIVNLLLVASIMFYPLQFFRKNFKPVISFIVFLLIAGSVVFMGETEENKTFRNEMKLSRMIDMRDWDGVLSNMPENRSITHAQNAFRVIALANKGELAEHLFNLKLPFVPYTYQFASDLLIYYSDLFFYSSFISVAQQLNMEQWVTVGENYKELKYFVLLALIQGDDNLAIRYIDLMKKTMNLKDLASKYESYVNDKTLLYADYPEFVKLKQNMPKEDKSLSGHTYFVKNYFKFNYLEGDNIERRLLADLYVKNIDGFVKEFSMVKNRFQNVPSCMKEALILKAVQTRNTSYLKVVPIEKQLILKVQQFLSDVSKNRGEGVDKLASSFYKDYSNMYCYYYMFGEDVMNEFVIK